MKLIGLTGIMGAGKSSVIEILGQMDIMVLDCDKINAQLIAQDGGAYGAILEKFGKTILDDNQNIDTKKMSAIIFHNIEKKQELESILHPMIKSEIQRAIAKHQDLALLVVEVPLLFEVKWETFFDEVWVVACEESMLLKRLEKYRHINIEETKKRLAHQMPQDEKMKRADVVLMNDRNLDYLRMQIEKEILRLERK